MKVPGSNLYRLARKVIGGNAVTWFAFKGREQNEARQWVTTFAAPVALNASVQAVPRNRYAQLGLDFQRNYCNIFADVNAVDLHRDASGDQFVFNGGVYQIESNTQWYAMDGWNECLVVFIANGTEPVTTAGGK